MTTHILPAGHRYIDAHAAHVGRAPSPTGGHGLCGTHVLPAAGGSYSGPAATDGSKPKIPSPSARYLPEVTR